jgi:predicted DsbA family dithiol-disulfide isomerase
MSRLCRPLQLVLYQDVLCAWCFIAEQRLAVLKAELGDTVRWKVRPFPLRTQDSVPSPRELSSWAKDIEDARKEVEGQSLSPELWTAPDPPRNSIPALAALEAARLQSHAGRNALARALQRAALEQGLNVTRSDVLFEMAASVGLDMNRFVAAYQSQETRRLITEEHRMATERGVKGVPTLVIGGKWMICGLREVSEYRQHVLACLEKVERKRYAPSDRTLH